MISAFLLTVASISGPAAVPATAYAADTISHMKGHLPAPARTRNATNDSRPVVAGACNPDPVKGRACRHHRLQEEAAGRVMARAGNEEALRAQAIR